jgi:hypothetical protein
MAVNAVLTGFDVLLTVAYVRPLNVLFNQVPCDIKLHQRATKVFLGDDQVYDALIKLFEDLMGFLKHLEIYMEMQLSTMMTDFIVEILCEALSVVSLATGEIKNEKGLIARLSECTITIYCPWLDVP